MQIEQKNLTPREQEIFDLLIKGISPKDIVFKLGISLSTVDYHRNNIYRKMGVKNIHELKATYKKTISNSLASEEIPYIITPFYNLPWAWTYVITFPMFLNNKITQGDIYTFFYSFKSNIDFDLMEIAFSDQTVGNGLIHLFQGVILSNIKANTVHILLLYWKKQQTAQILLQTDLLLM